MSDFLKDIIKETGNEYATLAKDGVADGDVGKGGGEGYLVTNYEAKNISRQFIADNEYMGTADSSNDKPMSYDDAYNAYESINDVCGIAGLKCCLGQLNALQQKYDRAEDEYKMAMTLYKNTNDIVGQATVFSELGKLYQCMDQPLKAAEFFMNAVKLYNSIG